MKIRLRRRRRVRQEMIAAAVAAVAYHLKVRGTKLGKAVPKAVAAVVAGAPAPQASWVINWRLEVCNRLYRRGGVRSW